MINKNLILFNQPVEVNHQLILEMKKQGGKGIQRLYFYPNGYGASLVKFGWVWSDGKFCWGHHGNAKTWELAVLKGSKITGLHITYKTPITNDVMGHLTDEEVEVVLDKIQRLPRETWQVKIINFFKNWNKKAWEKR